MQELIIIGAGGLGREVYDLALDTRAYDIRGFVDANATTAPGGSPILGTPEDYEIQPDDVFVCAIGNPHARKRCVEQLQRRGARFATLVHPTAIISPSVKMAGGCIIKPYVYSASRNCCKSSAKSVLCYIRFVFLIQLIKLLFVIV